ncbi:hypothetical protein YB2330_002591 [Saitoella coloradoensis]
MSSLTLPKEYTAYTYTHHGPPTTVLNPTQLPLPTTSALSPTHLLIRTTSLALNPIDHKFMLNTALGWTGLITKPSVPCEDVSGVVVWAGDEVKEEFAVGTRVWGVVDAPDQMKRGGTLGEYALLNSAHAIPLPTEGQVGLVDAGGLGCSSLTAYQALVQDGGLREGHRVLVNGASGGVGTMAIQMAKHIVGPGGVVVGACSAKNVELVMELGADDVVDYTAGDLGKQLAVKYGKEPFDLVLDTVGIDDLYHTSPKFLKAEGGKYVNVGAEVTSLSDILRLSSSMIPKLLQPTWLGGTPRPYIFSALKITKDKLEAVNTMAKDGVLRVIVDSKWEFGKRESVIGAFEKIMEKRARGKVLIVVRDEE